MHHGGRSSSSRVDLSAGSLDKSTDKSAGGGAKVSTWYFEMTVNNSRKGDREVLFWLLSACVDRSPSARLSGTSDEVDCRQDSVVVYWRDVACSERMRSRASFMIWDENYNVQVRDKCFFRWPIYYWGYTTESSCIEIFEINKKTCYNNNKTIK